MNLTPIRDRILVQPDAAETQTTSGIIIPDTAQEKPVFGTVLDTGTGKVAEDGTIVPLDVTPGDRIIYNKNAGVPVKVDGKDFLILTEDDILALVQE